MSDLISRQDALKIVEDYIDGSFEWGAMMLKLHGFRVARDCREKTGGGK